MTTYSDLPVHVTRGGAEPLSVQIARQIRDAVSAGVLRRGERLPSSREMAGSLAVSRTVVTAAYTQLFAEGWLEGRHGSGTYVADVLPFGSPRARLSGAGLSGAGRSGAGLPGAGPPGAGLPGANGPLAPSSGANGSIAAGRFGANGSIGVVRFGAYGSPAPGDPAVGEAGGARGAGGAAIGGVSGAAISLRPGIPWAAGVDEAMWRRAFRYAGTRPPTALPAPAGLPELRAELAGQLRRGRALAVDPDQVVITRGVASGLMLLAAEIVRPGDRVGVEEPGYPAARRVLARAGAVVVPCPVDAEGLVVDALPSGLKLVYTTPAHQYPLGGRLPVRRRQALIAWARRSGALIVEDDYDSEFRYDVAPLPSMCGMDPEVVVYLGTTSKVLAPGLGAGWLVTGHALAQRLTALREDLGDRAPEPVQHAVLAMLRSGDLARHIRRMRLEYASRREAVTRGLSEGGAGGRLLGETAGLHVVLRLPSSQAVARVVAYAADRGVAVDPLDRYYAGPVTTPALIVGYGLEPLPRIERAVGVLAEALRATGRGTGRPAGRATSRPVRRAASRSADSRGGE